MFLNKEQTLVVNELEKNILLLASAGTGKTNTLSSRISNIISTKKQKLKKYYVLLLLIKLVQK